MFLRQGCSRVLSGEQVDLGGLDYERAAAGLERSGWATKARLDDEILVARFWPTLT